MNTTERLIYLEGEIAKEPSSPKLLNDYANVLALLERTSEALEYYNRSIALRPNYAVAFNNRAGSLRRLGRYEEALSDYDRAISLEPGFTLAFINRGVALRDMSHLEEALASLDRAIELDPASASAFNNRAGVLRELKRLDEAVAGYSEAIRLKLDYYEAYNNRAITLHDLGRYDVALADVAMAISLNKVFAPSYYNQALILKHLDRLDEALASADRAVVLQPDYIEALNQGGNILFDLGRTAESIKNYARAATIDAGNSKVRYNQSLSILKSGNLREGWKEYEWRRKLDTWTYKFDGPEWTGEDIGSKTLLVYCEQGLGDTIQFCRFAVQMAKRCAIVILMVQKPLVELLRSLANVTVVAQGVKVNYHYHVPLMSLPRVLACTEDQLWPGAPYLRPDLGVNHWRDVLPAGYNVGIAWQGNPKFKRDRTRSIPLNAFKPLSAIEGVNLVSLQRNYGTEQINGIPQGMRLYTLSELDNFNGAFVDTALAMQALDLCITTDTALAHLAGALSVKVWLVLEYAPDWRWMDDRTDSPWYPTMRIYRQHRLHDWSGAMEDVRRDLHGIVAQRV